jgi:flagellin
MQLSTSTVSALSTQRTLESHTVALNRSMERLATGSRINSAADDVAGVGVAQRMTAQLASLNQALANTSKGLSYLATMDTSYYEVQGLLRRMEELTVQALNTTYASTDRRAMMQEFSALIAEMDRISEKTTFNGERVFPASYAGFKQIQVGTQAYDLIPVTPITVAPQRLFWAQQSGYFIWSDSTPGHFGPSSSPPANTTPAFNISIAGKNGDVNASFPAGSSARDVADIINSHYEGTGVFAGRAETFVYLEAVDPSDDKVTLTINGVTTEEFDLAPSGYDEFVAARAAIDGITSQTGVRFNGIGTDQNNNPTGISLISITGDDIEIELNSATQVNVYPPEPNGAALALNADDSITISGAIKLMSTESFTITQLDANAPAYFDENAWGTDGQWTSTLSGLGTSLTSQFSATFGINSRDASLTFEYAPELTLLQIESARTIVFSAQGEIAGKTRQLEHTLNTIMITSQSLAESRSRVQDTDYAAETANLSRSVLLRNASTALLAQAVKRPEMVLALLR